MKKIILVFILWIGFVSHSQNKKYTTYRVSTNETISSIARKLNVTPYDLFRLNPDAKDGIDIDEVLIVPNKNFKVTATEKTVEIPKNTNSIIKDSIIDGFLYHTVRTNETIYFLSNKYNVSKRKIRKLNNLDKNGIDIGQVLKFPTNLPNCCQKTVIHSKKENREPVLYTVKANDTYYKLTHIYHVTQEELIKINPMLQDGLKEGLTIKIPKKQENAIIKAESAMDSLYVAKPKFKIHQVKEQEGFFRLQQLYNVTEEEIRAVNPLIDGLKKDMLIKIPIKEQVAAYKLHQVQEQEGFFRLQQLYGFSEEEIRAVNPELEYGLKVGMLLKIPNNTKDYFDFELPKYVTHVVEEQENFFKLTQLYKITKEELIAINPILSEGLKVGMEIKVPVKKEDILFKEGDIQGKFLNLVMLMPFKANKDTSFLESNKNSRLNKVTDFYLGSLMALDSIKKKGLSVTAKVLDTKQSDFVVQKILETYDFSTTDVVIAPISFKQIKEVSVKLKYKNIPIVSPISSIDCSEITHSVQNMPTAKVTEYKVLSYILKQYKKQNIVIIADEKKEENKFNIEEIKSNLVKYTEIPLDSISVIRMDEGYIKHKLFKKVIKEDIENWVILASDNELTTSIAVENLAVFSEEVKINLFALSKPKNLYSTSSNHKIKNTYLNKLNFLYPEVHFSGNTKKEIAIFDTSYKLKYGSYPSDFSYKGFDATYDVLLRLANYSDQESAFQSGRTNRLITSFNYKKTNTNSYTNFGVYLMRYVNYQLEVVE